MNSLTGVRSFVYLEVLTARKHLAATRKRAVERPLARVYPYVVDQLVLGLEWPTASIAACPTTCVVRLVGTTHVFDGDMNNGLLNGAELAATQRSSIGAITVGIGGPTTEHVAAAVRQLMMGHDAVAYPHTREWLVEKIASWQ